MLKCCPYGETVGLSFYLACCVTQGDFLSGSSQRTEVLGKGRKIALRARCWTCQISRAPLLLFFQGITKRAAFISENHNNCRIPASPPSCRTSSLKMYHNVLRHFYSLSAQWPGQERPPRGTASTNGSQFPQTQHACPGSVSWLLNQHPSDVFLCETSQICNAGLREKETGS